LAGTLAGTTFTPIDIAATDFTCTGANCKTKATTANVFTADIPVFGGRVVIDKASVWRAETKINPKGDLKVASVEVLLPTKLSDASEKILFNNGLS